MEVRNKTKNRVGGEFAFQRRAGVAGGRGAPDRRREGAVAIIVAVMLVMLLGFSALAVDVGNLYRVRSELQNAADAAALVGARYLDGSQDGIDEARDNARQQALAHLANNADVDVRDEDIHFGVWNSAAAKLSPEDPEYVDPFTDFGPEPDNDQADDANAVRVEGLRSKETGDPVQHYFAQLLGDPDSDISAAAIAVGGSPVDACDFPLVVGECSLKSADVNGLCEMCLVFHADGSDSAGWSSFVGSNGNPKIADAIEAACFEDGEPNINEEGFCDNGCQGPGYGDEIQVKNGDCLTTAKKDFCQLIKDIINRDGVGNPKSFLVKAPVIEDNNKPGACNTDFKNDQKVIGRAVLEIFGVKCGNADKKDESPAMASGAPDYCEDVTSNDKYVVAALHCDMEPEGHGGGAPGTGYQSRFMRLVR